MKICYFGIYNPQYSRNRIMIKGLKENGAEVIECRVDNRGWGKYLKLAMRHWKIRHDYDIIIVGFAGNHSTVLAKFLTRKLIIFDAFSSSFYDSMIFDRQVSSPRSLKAKYYWLLDWLPCKLADKIILDTQSHIDYFASTFHVEKEKFERVFVGTDDSQVYFDPAFETERDYFLVHYHASFLPLQGIEYIVKAAKILEKENIRFNIIGNGPEYGRIRKMVDGLETKNIDFVKPVPYSELRKYISAADICLGIFGHTPKTGRVIPNKIFEAIACGRAVITADEPAINELFTDRENIVLCRAADPEDLAEKTLELKNDAELKEKIGRAARKLYLEKLTPETVTKELFNKMKEWTR